MSSSKEIKSKFKLEFEAPGAEQTKKKIEGINKALSPSKITGGMEALSKIQSRNLRQMAAMQKQVASLSKTFAGLEKIVDRIGKAMDKIEGGGGRGGSGGGERRPPISGGGGGRSGGGGGGGAGGGGEGNFTRGVLQGAGFGQYYPSNQRAGMIRQAFGASVGSFGRQVGGGLASSPFTGMAGIQQAAGGIPFVGGIASGAIGQAMGYGQSALAYQQSRLGLTSVLGRQGVAGVAAGGQAYSDTYAKVMAGGIDESAVRAAGDSVRSRSTQAAEVAASKVEAPGQGTKPNPFGFGIPAAIRADPSLDVVGASAKEAETLKRKELLQGLSGKAASEAGAARAAVDPLSRLTASGNELMGKGAIETNQFIGALLGRGGPGASENFMETAMAASTLFGVGAETSGAFQKGQKRGGISGVGSSATDMLVNSIQEATAAGMDETEVRDFLQHISQAQDQFLSGGMPISPGSLARMAGSLGGTGLGAGRGMALGQSISERMKNIAATGEVNSPLDFQLMRLKGYKGSGGSGDMRQALKAMESGELSPDEQRQLFSIMGGGAGVNEDSAVIATKNRLATEFGVKMTDQEVMQLRHGTFGLKQFGPEETPEMMKARAKTSTDIMGGGVKDQNTIDNMGIMIGEKLLPALQAFEISSQNTAKAFAEFSPSLKALGEASQAITEKLPALAGKAEWVIEKILNFIGVNQSGG